jgi:hypothetical protein
LSSDHVPIQSNDITYWSSIRSRYGKAGSCAGSRFRRWRTDRSSTTTFGRDVKVNRVLPALTHCRDGVLQVLVILNDENVEECVVDALRQLMKLLPKKTVLEFLQHPHHSTQANFRQIHVLRTYRICRRLKVASRY